MFHVYMFKVYMFNAYLYIHMFEVYFLIYNVHVSVIELSERPMEIEIKRIYTYMYVCILYYTILHYILF